MKSASIQLTYIKEEAEARRRLSKRSLLERDALPCDIELPGAGKLFTIDEDSGHCAVINPAAGVKVLLNGREITGKEPLSAGDRVNAGGYLLDFHFRHEARGLSKASRALSLGAKVAVCVFIACELAIMLGLSSILSMNRLFEGTSARQRLSFDIIRIQVKLASINPDDPMKQAMLALIKDDITRRISYMGDFGDMLSPRQRKNMNRDLRRIDVLLDNIAKDGNILPDEKVNLNDAVKDIIEHHKINIR